MGEIKTSFLCCFQLKTPRKNNVISMVDLYGFALSAGNNGFQQMAINYSNEKLHQAVNQWYLREEQQELATEGLEWEEVDFEDNSDTCAAIERSSCGVLACVDEVSLRRGEALTSVSSSEGEGTPATVAELMVERLRERLADHHRITLPGDEEDDEEGGLPRNCFR